MKKNRITQNKLIFGGLTLFFFLTMLLGCQKQGDCPAESKDPTKTDIDNPPKFPKSPKSDECAQERAERDSVLPSFENNC